MPPKVPPKKPSGKESADDKATPTKPDLNNASPASMINPEGDVTPADSMYMSAALRSMECTVNALMFRKGIPPGEINTRKAKPLESSPPVLQRPPTPPSLELQSALQVLKEQGDKLAKLVRQQHSEQIQNENAAAARRHDEEMRHRMEELLRERNIVASNRLSSPEFLSEYEPDVNELLNINDALTRLRSNVSNITAQCSELVQSVPRESMSPHRISDTEYVGDSLPPTPGPIVTNKPEIHKPISYEELSPKNQGGPPCGNFEPHFFKPSLCANCNRSRLNHEAQKDQHLARTNSSNQMNRKPSVAFSEDAERTDLSPKNSGPPPCNDFEPHFFKPQICAKCKRSRLNHEGASESFIPSKPTKTESNANVSHNASNSEDMMNQLSRKASILKAPPQPSSASSPEFLSETITAVENFFSQKQAPPPPQAVVESAPPATNRIPMVPTMKIVNLDGGHSTIPMAVPLAPGVTPGYAVPCALPIRISEDVTNKGRWLDKSGDFRSEQRSHSADSEGKHSGNSEALSTSMSMASTEYNAYRQILSDFYQQHNPKKVSQVDWILNQFKGEEAQLLILLALKYNVPVPALPSEGASRLTVRM